MDDVRQGIHFDMDTRALGKYYPKTAWRAAYDDVRGFLEQKGFTHEQGSGYHSVKPMTQAEAVDILDELLVEYPWLHKCVRVCTVADVPVTFDVSNLFDKDADISERAELLKTADRSEDDRVVQTEDGHTSVLQTIKADRERKRRQQPPERPKKTKDIRGPER